MSSGSELNVIQLLPHVAQPTKQLHTRIGTKRDVFLVMIMMTAGKRNQIGTLYLRSNLGGTHPRVLLLEGLVRSMLLENYSGSDAN